jgi:hypothetical protein
MSRQNSRLDSRPRTTSSVPSLRNYLHVRRWPQIAAVRAVPVITFRGIQEIPGRDVLLHINPPPPPDSGFKDSESMQSVLADGECQRVSEDISDLSDHDSKFLARLGEYLRLRAQNAAAQGEYEDATSCAKKREVVLLELRTRHKPPPSREEAQEYEAMIQERQDEWAQEMADFDAGTQRHIEDLHQRHEDELRQLDDHWESVEQEKYRRPSAELIRQRILEADMIHRDQIERARFIHEGVKLLEQREFEEAQDKYEVDYRKARAFKIDLQKEGMDKFMWQRECERLILVRHIEKQERILSNRLNVLHGKIAPIESFRLRTIEEVPTRPVVPLTTACNPGEKLPRLIFKGAARLA